MNFLNPFCHLRLSESFRMMFCDQLGHNLYLLDETWKDKVRYDFVFTDVQKGHPWLLKHPNIHLISYEEFMETDKIDIVMQTCYENMYDVIKSTWVYKRNKIKFISYYGNDFIAPSYVPMDMIKNHIAADIGSYEHAIKKGLHTLEMRPPIDYNIFEFKPVTEYKKVKSYIHNYQPVWTEYYNKFTEITKQFPNIEFPLYGKSGDGGVLETAKDVAREIYDSCLTNEIKTREGYGFNVIESMACGRPVIAYRPMVEIRRFREWVTDETSILFTTTNEAVDKMRFYLNNKNYAEELQIKAHNTVKNMIDPNVESQKLNEFLKNLR